MTGVGPLHRIAALRAGVMLRSEVERPNDNETCDAWLRRMGQTSAMRAVFWDPLIWAVLNDDPLVCSAAMLVAVLERAFLGTRDASCLGVPRVPLTELYVPQALELLRERGATVHLGDPMRQIIVENDTAVGVTLRSGEELRADAVISSVPPQPLLDALPEAALRHPVFQDVGRLNVSPIINLWVFTDRPIWPREPFLGLVNSPLHWMFDRSRIEGRVDRTTLINCTISGARSCVDDSPETLMALFEAEMKRFFPRANYRIEGYKVVKEKRATITHAAGTTMMRPETRSPINGLLLAGDWVRTGLPATIESACQSGHDAAAVVLG